MPQARVGPSAQNRSTGCLQTRSSLLYIYFFAGLSCGDLTFATKLSNYFCLHSLQGPPADVAFFSMPIGSTLNLHAYDMLEMYRACAIH